MGQLTSSRPCAVCGTRVMAVKGGTSHGIHLFLSLLTVGLWVPLWIIAALMTAANRWTCSRCGLDV